MATTSLISGDVVITSVDDGTEKLIDFGTDATLNFGPEIIGTGSKASSGYVTNIQGRTDWSITYSGLLDFSSTVNTGEDLNVTVGGDAISGLTSASATLISNAAETANTTTGLFLTRVPTTKAFSLSVEVDYYDPGYDETPTPGQTNNPGLYTVIEEAIGTTNSGLAVVLTFGPATNTVTATMRPSQISLSAPAEGIVTGTIPFESTGSFTITDTNLNSGLGAIVTAFDADTTLTARFKHVSSGTTAVSGDAEYTGSVYVTQIALTIPFSGTPTYEATLSGSGALTVQAAA